MLNIESVKCEYCPYKQEIEKVKADVVDEFAKAIMDSEIEGFVNKNGKVSATLSVFKNTIWSTAENIKDKYLQEK